MSDLVGLSETPKTGFLAMRLICLIEAHYQIVSAKAVLGCIAATLTANNIWIFFSKIWVTLEKQQFAVSQESLRFQKIFPDAVSS